MALPAGLTITCASSGQKDAANKATQPVLAYPEWSETLTASGTTTQSAKFEGAVYHFTAVLSDWYIAVGKVPNASLAISTSTNSARIPLPAGSVLDLYVHKGDFAAAVLV